MENHMGENGLSAEEEYKRGHYTCGVYELSPSPPHVPASHLHLMRFHAISTASSMYPRSLRGKAPSLASTARDSPGVHLDARIHDRP